MLIITSINDKKSVGIFLPAIATFRFLSTPSGLINLPSPMINLMIVAARFDVSLKSSTQTLELITLTWAPTSHKTLQHFIPSILQSIRGVGDGLPSP